MKSVGIVGGTGPESTIDYYRRIIRRYAERRGAPNAPSILINSVDNVQALGLVAAGQFEALTTYFCTALDRLAKAGADFAVLAANTSHIVFDEVQARSPLPLISIVEVTRSAAAARGLKRPGLIGTRFTMQGDFYQRVFSRVGIEIVTPNDADQQYVHDKYIGELIKGMFLKETHDGLVAVIERLYQTAAIDSIILGGTELALIIDEPQLLGIPVLDTAGLHIEEIVSRLVS
jgi:aspartate racemase